MEDRLGLASVTGLFAIVTALSLGEKGRLAGLVLGDLVLGVLLAGLALAIGLTGLGDVDLPISQGISQPAGKCRALSVLLFLFAGGRERPPVLSKSNFNRLRVVG